MSEYDTRIREEQLTPYGHHGPTYREVLAARLERERQKAHRKVGVVYITPLSQSSNEPQDQDLRSQSNGSEDHTSQVAAQANQETERKSSLPRWTMRVQRWSGRGLVDSECPTPYARRVGPVFQGSSDELLEREEASSQGVRLRKHYPKVQVVKEVVTPKELETTGEVVKVLIPDWMSPAEEVTQCLAEKCHTENPEPRVWPNLPL